MGTLGGCLIVVQGKVCDGSLILQTAMTNSGNCLQLAYWELSYAIYEEYTARLSSPSWLTGSTHCVIFSEHLSGVLSIE